MSTDDEQVALDALKAVGVEAKSLDEVKAALAADQEWRRQRAERQERDAKMGAALVEGLLSLARNAKPAPPPKRTFGQKLNKFLFGFYE